MAIALVQHRNTLGNGSSSPLGLAYTSAPTAGNLLIAVGLTDGNLTSSISDTNTNTWTNGPSSTVGGVANGRVALWYAANCKAGATTVNLAWSGGGASDPHLAIYELSGVATTSPLDTSNTGGDGTSAVHSITTAAAITNANDYVIAAFGSWNAANTYTNGTSYTVEDTSNNTTGGDSLGVEDRILSGAALATQTASITFANSTASNQIIAAFLPAAAGLTVAQETPNWYTDGETASSARSQYTLGNVQFHHETFVADAFDPGKPILPVSATSGIWYNEHLDFPNIQGPQHKMQDVDLERWTQRVLLPAQPPWDNDAENQNAQVGNQGIGSDQGLDWTQLIIIPGLDASVSRVDIDDFSNQFPNPGWAAALAEYETWTQNVLIPTVAWDTDTDNQVQQDGYHVNDANLDWTEFVVLQVLQFDPSTSFVDSDVDYQSPQAGYSGLGSDSGQDWVQYILIPAPAWDGDLDHANVNPTLAQGPYFFNDETVGVPIVFIPANGGPAFTLYIPLHQLSALHGLSQL